HTIMSRALQRRVCTLSVHTLLGYTDRTMDYSSSSRRYIPADFPAPSVGLSQRFRHTRYCCSFSNNVLLSLVYLTVNVTTVVKYGLSTNTVYHNSTSDMH